MLKLSVFKIFLVALGTVLVSLAFYAATQPTRKIVDETATVYIKTEAKGFQLYRNGAPFKIKGVAGEGYLKTLAYSGANTIRIYNSDSIKSILDEAQHYNLAVIVDIPLSKYTDGDNFYSDTLLIATFKDSIKALVKTYKNHPALLFWNLGNELDYPMVLKTNDFIDTFNEFIEIIHTEDPNHPVGTSIIPSQTQTLSIHLHSPQLDFIGFNAFGNLDMITPLMHKISIVSNVLPYYISEYASNGPWEEENTIWSVPIEQTSVKKAEQYMDNYNTYIRSDTNSMGDLAFYWGQKQEHTHTWFNIFDEVGRKSHAFYNLKTIWGQPVAEDDWPPQIEYMLIDGHGSKDTLIYNAKDIKRAQIVMKDDATIGLDYKWEIYKEGWNYQSQKSEQRPEMIPMTIINEKENSISFTTPDTAGPYRIFVYVYDQKGNYATSNIPFYVLEK